MCCWRLAANTGRKKVASSIRPYNMVNFGLLVAEILSLIWGTPANFNGFRVLAALLHDTVVVGISQTLWRSTEGGHHFGHWPTFLLSYFLHVHSVPGDFSLKLKF